MGVNFHFACYFDGDPGAVLSRELVLDRDASNQLARTYHPGTRGEPIAEKSLYESCLGPSKDLYIGCYGAACIVAGDRIDHTPDHRLMSKGMRHTFYYSRTDTADQIAFSFWRERQLVRSFAHTPHDGIIEDVGERLPFETPFWAGEFAPEFLDDDYDEDEPHPLPFVSEQFLEAALVNILGVSMFGPRVGSLPTADDIPVLRYSDDPDRAREEMNAPEREDEQNYIYAILRPGSRTED